MSQLIETPAPPPPTREPVIDTPVIETERPAGKFPAEALATAATATPNTSTATPSPEQPQENPTPDADSSHASEWHLASKPSGRWWNPWLWLWGTYGWLAVTFSWLPIPHYWGSIKSRTRWNHGRIWDLSQLAVSVFLFVARKGGVGKTTVTCWFAADYARHTDNTTVIVDADSGAKGDAAARFAIDMSRVTFTFHKVLDLILRNRWRPTNRELSRFLPRDPQTGVRILAPTGKLEVSKRNMQVMLGHLSPATCLFIDATPGDKEENTKGAWKKTEIVGVPLMFDTVDIARSINLMREEENEAETGFSKRLSDGTLFIIANDVSRRKFNRRTQYETARTIGVDPHQVILLPRDKHIKRAGHVDWSLASPLYRYAVSEGTRIMTEAAAKYNAVHPLDEPSDIVLRTPVERQIATHAATLINLAGSQEEAAEIVLGLEYALAE